MIDVKKDLDYIIRTQAESWMNTPQLPNWYKRNKYIEIKNKFYNNNVETIQNNDYFKLRFYQTFDRWVKMNFKFCLEDQRKQVDVLY